MTIKQVLTPVTEVQWLAATDTACDALDHMEAYDLTAAPILDWRGRYVGTLTAADLRRHLASGRDRAVALATPVARIERRARYEAVTLDASVDSLVAQAAARCFVPVVDDTGKLVGIVGRERILDGRMPSAA